MCRSLEISWTLACHLSLGSSIVRASHRSSEGCGFHPSLGLRNCFSGVRAWRTFIYHSTYLQVPTFLVYIIKECSLTMLIRLMHCLLIIKYIKYIIMWQWIHGSTYVVWRPLVITSDWWTDGLNNTLFARENTSPASHYHTWAQPEI